MLLKRFLVFFSIFDELFSYFDIFLRILEFIVDLRLKNCISFVSYRKVYLRSPDVNWKIQNSVEVEIWNSSVEWYLKLNYSNYSFTIDKLSLLCSIVHLVDLASHPWLMRSSKSRSDCNFSKFNNPLDFPIFKIVWFFFLSSQLFSDDFPCNFYFPLVSLSSLLIHSQTLGKLLKTFLIWLNFFILSLFVVFSSSM